MRILPGNSIIECTYQLCSTTNQSRTQSLSHMYSKYLKRTSLSWSLPTARILKIQPLLQLVKIMKMFSGLLSPTSLQLRKILSSQVESVAKNHKAIVKKTRMAILEIAPYLSIISYYQYYQLFTLSIFWGLRASGPNFIIWIFSIIWWISPIGRYQKNQQNSENKFW